MNKVNCTLYVGGIHIKPNTEQLLVKIFKNLVLLRKSECCRGKGCAFVTMKTENQAQFAKEAMQSQSLVEGSNEVLYVNGLMKIKPCSSEAREKDNKNWPMIQLNNY